MIVAMFVMSLITHSSSLRRLVQSELSARKWFVAVSVVTVTSLSTSTSNEKNASRCTGLSGAQVVPKSLSIVFRSTLSRLVVMSMAFNRSGRPTDSKLIAALAGAPFQVSGAQGWVKNIFSTDDINVVWDNGVTTWRNPLRPRPHNLYTSSLLVREWADEQGWPDDNAGNLFTYGEATEGEDEATAIEVEYSSSPTSNWLWDDELGQYLHFQGDEEHLWVTEDGETGPVAFDTVVVMKMRKYIARNPAGSGTSLPTVDSVGTGDAFVFMNGQVVGGTWERASINDRFFLIGTDGTEIVLPPGRVWMSLIPDDRTVTWE